MLLILLAFCGGILTILSPCVLPVVPFVFARADQSFRRATLPMLAGMGLTFALFAALATAGGNWIVRTNQYGRALAMVVLALLGLSLLLPAVAERLSRPLVRLGNRIQSARPRGPQAQAGPAGSILLGASIGLLWAPCAGPILGLVLAAAALSGVSLSSAALLLAFAAGAATSLAVALLAGKRVLRALQRGFGAETWIRRALGIAVLAGVAAIALGLDTRFLAAFSYLNTNGIEQSLVNRFAAPHSVSTAAPAPGNSPGPAVPAADANLPVPLLNYGRMPPLRGAVAWLNSPPLDRDQLRGKVVLIDFWTYSCINCLRTLPYVEAWYAKYKDQGLVVIGVHSPEFAFERNTANVAKALSTLHVAYPVAVDSNSTIWNAFHNRYWPADYLVDANGVVRYQHFGEGDYDGGERAIQELLAEARNQPPAAALGGLVEVAGAGSMAPAAPGDLSSETYIGYDRREHFASPQALDTDLDATYTTPAALARNQWGLTGRWNVNEEWAQLLKPGGAIVFRFHARDLHLVLGSEHNLPVRFIVTLDGAPPGPNHGVDTDAGGHGTVQGNRLYNLIRLATPAADHTFKIQFLDPALQAFSFTFG